MRDKKEKPQRVKDADMREYAEASQEVFGGACLDVVSFWRPCREIQAGVRGRDSVAGIAKLVRGEKVLVGKGDGCAGGEGGEPVTTKSEVRRARRVDHLGAK